MLRADAQLGTAVIIKQVKSAGFHYLFKGLSSARAVNLVKQATNTFWRVKPVNQRDVRWVSDLGVIEHLDRSNKGDGSAIETRTVVMTQVKQVEPPKPGAHRKRVGDKQVVINNYYYLTDLNNQQLSIADLLDTYDDRATIERYFYDEQYALGAQQVRTGHFQGEALFQFVVATTNNLLRWMQHRVFRKTELEQLGLKRLIRQAIRIPAQIIQTVDKVIVKLPKQNHLVNLLSRSWGELSIVDST